MYGLTKDNQKAEAFFEKHKDVVLNAIRNREKWWIYPRNGRQYLITEDSTTREFFKTCLNDESYLRKLLTGQPNELLEFTQYFFDKGGKTDSFFKEQSIKKRSLDDQEKKIVEKFKNKEVLTSEDKTTLRNILKNKKVADFNRCVSRVFIEGIYNKTDLFCKVGFVKNKNLRICPYCGRNYIFSIDRDDKVVKPQIDHFLPKGKFPFLALSFYNMIPCCTTCNVDIKGEKHALAKTYDKYEVPHPYEYEDKWIFCFKLNNTDIFSEFASVQTENIEIEFKGDAITLDVHNNLFAVKDLYKEHNDIAHELLIRKQYWTSNVAQGFYQDILNDKTVRSKMILSLLGYPESTQEYTKRPFAKFLKEISDYYDELVNIGKQ